MANEEEAFLDVVEIEEIDKEQTPSRKRTDNAKERQGNGTKWKRIF